MLYDFSFDQNLIIFLVNLGSVPFHINLNMLFQVWSCKYYLNPHYWTYITIKYDIFDICKQTTMPINISKIYSQQNDYIPHNQSSYKEHFLLFLNNYLVFLWLIIFSVNSSVFEYLQVYKINNCTVSYLLILVITYLCHQKFYNQFLKLQLITIS